MPIENRKKVWWEFILTVQENYYTSETSLRTHSIPSKYIGTAIRYPNTLGRVLEEK